MAKLPALAGHPLEVVSGPARRPALGDVVDPALDDQGIGPLRALVEAQGDLVGALAEDAAVAEARAVELLVGPVLELAALVRSRDLRPGGRVGVPQRRARGDRVAERGDHRLGLLAAVLAFPAAARQGHGEDQQR